MFGYMEVVNNLLVFGMYVFNKFYVIRYIYVCVLFMVIFGMLEF